MMPAKATYRTCCLVLVLMALAIAPSLADGLRLGTAAVKITPPLGIPLASYYSAGRRSVC